MFYFFTLSLCDTVENRVFIQNNPNFTGSWEYSGDSLIDQNNIFYLLPENSKNASGAYYTSSLKFHNFSSDFVIKFSPNEKQITNLGIWITKDYHMDARVFGGPLTFSGIGLLLQFNGTVLSTELRKNNERGKFLTYHFFPTSFVTLNDFIAHIRIIYKNDTIIVYINDKKEFEEVPLQNIYKFYMSITGNQVHEHSPVSVISALVSKDCDDNFLPIQKTVTSFNIDSKDSIERDKKAKQEYQRMEKSQSTPRKPESYKIDEVLDELFTFSLYTDVITKDKDVKNLIFNEFVPYADAWQRRSINIVKKTQNLRKNLTIVLNESYKSLALVKYEVDTQLGKLKKKLQSIESDIFFGINDGYSLQDDIKAHEEEGTKGIGKILLLVGITEVNVLATFFIIIFIKNKIKGN